MNTQCHTASVWKSAIHFLLCYNVNSDVLEAAKAADNTKWYSIELVNTSTFLRCRVWPIFLFKGHLVVCTAQTKRTKYVLSTALSYHISNLWWWIRILQGDKVKQLSVSSLKQLIVSEQSVTILSESFEWDHQCLSTLWRLTSFDDTPFQHSGHFRINKLTPMWIMPWFHCHWLEVHFRVVKQWQTWNLNSEQPTKSGLVSPNGICPAKRCYRKSCPRKASIQRSGITDYSRSTLQYHRTLEVRELH